MGWPAFTFKDVCEQPDVLGWALGRKHESIIGTQACRDRRRELTHGLTHRRSPTLPQARRQLCLKEDPRPYVVSDDEIVNIIVRLNGQKSRPHQKARNADIAEPGPAQNRLGQSRADQASKLRASLIGRAADGPP